MNLLGVLAVAIAGGIGSMLRYLVDNSIPARVRERFPWGTALVNVTGSFILGVVIGSISETLPTFWGDVIGVGLLGGYTTFSTVSLDTVRLALKRRRWAAALNGIGTLIVCVIVALLGFAL